MSAQAKAQERERAAAARKEEQLKKQQEQEAKKKQRQEEADKKKAQQEELRKQKEEKRKKEGLEKAAAEQAEKAKLAAEGGAQTSSFWPWSTQTGARDLEGANSVETKQSIWGWGSKPDDHKEQEAKPRVWGWGSKVQTDGQVAEAEQAQSKWGLHTLTGQSASSNDKATTYAPIAQHDKSTAKAEAVASKQKVQSFQAEWEDGGSERFHEFKSEFHVLPPLFKMPRLQFFPLGSQWKRAVDGPPSYMMPSCEQRLVVKSKKNKADAEDQADEAELAEEEQKRREKKSQPGCTRQYGLQLGLFFLWFGMAFYIKITYHKQYWRKINLLTCMLSQFIFTATWLKAMWKVSNILFVWLEGTEQHVEEGGEVVALFVRRMIFSRLFHLLIAEDDQVVHLLSVHGSKLYDEQAIDKCLGCMFVDHQGTLIRIAERAVDDERPEPPYIFRDNKGKGHEISQMTQWEPWHRPLRYAIDASSESVDEIVKANRWWNKFEKTLYHQQTVLNGYRGYLGPTCFDGRLKFIAFVGLGPPLCILGGFFGYRILMDTANPEVYLDSVLMCKHFMVVCCVCIVSNIVAIQANSFAFTYWVINKCMRVIEAGVNKELFYSGAEDVDSEDEDGDVEDIPLIWKKLRSQKNIMAIGQTVWSQFIENSTRKPYVLSQAQFYGIKRKFLG